MNSNKSFGKETQVVDFCRHCGASNPPRYGEGICPECPSWEEWIGLVEEVARAMYYWNTDERYRLIHPYEHESLRTAKYRELAKVAVNIMWRKDK